MDVAGSPSSSKVIIQCTDPANLTGVFEPRLTVRTPLKNLHWKSPSRPLRSIPSLNVSITKDDRLQDGQKPGVRRHQIPGLRETPYVKLYLVRCDDKETYKDRVRKEVRQWVKDNTQAKDGKSFPRNQEQHDAAEWMIVHVVLPDTVAASQPRSFKHISVEATESTDSLNSKAKWTGKSSSTIYDRLRADFDSSSKSQAVRVTQVRITEPGLPSGALSLAEIEEQWQDFIENLKACILRSFDARVAQYEEDIRERESQRNLPGWNFCTFFILKEGLARGFENVGLLDDALTVYEELEIGLDAVVKQQTQQDDVEFSGGLLPYSAELKSIIRAGIDLDHFTSSKSSRLDEQPLSIQRLLESDRDKFPFDIEKRKYRDLILANNVSALDFRIFMFTRKMEIQVRRAYGPAAPTGRSSSKLNTPMCNLDIMANLVESALNFINQVSRELRSDLYSAWGGRLSGSERASQRVVVSNIVSTWTWTAAMQVLSITLSGLDVDMDVVASSTSAIFESRLLDRVSVDESRSRSESRNGRSDRSSTSSPRNLSRTRSLQREHSMMREGGVTHYNGGSSATRPGATRLSAWVARLFLLARNIFEELPACEAFAHSVQDASRTIMSEAKSQEILPQQESELDIKALTKSLDSPSLIHAASTELHFDELYYFISKCAQYLFTVSKNNRSAQQIMVDIARATYQRRDYDLATEYLGELMNGTQRVVTVYMHTHLLEMYISCLQRREELDEYAKCLLKCLSTASQALPDTTLQRYADELLRTAPLIEPTIIPLLQTFEIISFDTCISHYPDRDGFFLSLDLKARFPATLKINEPPKMTLSSTDGSDPAKIVLECSDGVTIGPDSVKCVFGTACTTTGWYEFETMEITIGNIRFLHHFQKSEKSESKRKEDSYLESIRGPRLLVYPRAEAISIRLSAAAHVSLGKSRYITISLNSGANSFRSCLVRLRSATAGLRLQIHEVRFQESSSRISIETSQEDDISKLSFNDMGSGVSSSIDIPYSLENISEPIIVVKTDIMYQTDFGDFSFYQTHSVNVILPISINVQDYFRGSVSISRFTIAPATLGPLLLINCQVANKKELSVTAESNFANPVVAFPKQPASWIVKTRRPVTNINQEQSGFTLDVQFHCIDELVLDAFETAFVYDLAKTPYVHMSRLLTSHLLDILKQTWTEQDLEVAGLTQEIEPWKYHEQEWRAVLSIAKPEERPLLSEWLRTWHEIHEPLRLIPRDGLKRQIELRVDMPPNPPMLVTDLKLLPGRRSSSYAALGQPIHAELSIRTIEDFGQNQSDLELNYEIVAPSESWLIGGRKKGSLDCAALPALIPMIVVPQRVGHLLLPSIDIRVRQRDGQGLNGTASWTEVPVELHNRTISKVLFVLANLASTTIGMSTEAEATHGAGWVIDGQHLNVEQRINDDG